ncbi:unnamed protein product [Mytilus edulis]|uniref:Uncharacterized protein n=1 Tax=Mytilus edulis TaxID=6550 RepID=A0A8S3QW66_MYTED|nr:unnamed protein product [Mytilus edulis]
MVSFLSIRWGLLHNITTNLMFYEGPHMSRWTNTYIDKQGMQDITTDRIQLWKIFSEAINRTCTVTNDNNVNVKNCDLCILSTSNFHGNGHAEESNRNSLEEKKSSEIHIKRNPLKEETILKQNQLMFKRLMKLINKGQTTQKPFYVVPKIRQSKERNLLKATFQN